MPFLRQSFSFLSAVVTAFSSGQGLLLREGAGRVRTGPRAAGLRLVPRGSECGRGCDRGSFLTSAGARVPKKADFKTALDQDSS